MLQSYKNKFNKILTWTCFLLFVGRAWQHIRWDAPYRSLLWDQSWMEKLVFSLLGREWQDWAGNIAVSKGIETYSIIVGIFFLFCAFSLWLFHYEKYIRLSRAIIITGGAYLFLLSLLYWKSRYFQIGQLMEHAIQWSLPFFLLAFYKKPVFSSGYILAAKIAIAATFIGHGLYAMGYPALPGNFLQMTLDILPLNEEGARHFLWVMGLLDILMAVGIFWPGKEKYFLIYGITWGFLTALARIVAGFEVDFPLESTDQFLWETFIRLGHGSLPLLLWWGLRINPQARPPSSPLLPPQQARP